VLPLSEAIPTCRRCSIYVRRSPQLEERQPRDDRGINKAPIQAIVTPSAPWDDDKKEG